MASSFLRSRASRPLAVAGVLVGSLLFSGCAPAESPGSSPSPTAPATPTSGATDSPGAVPEPTQTPLVSEPVGVTCDAVLTPDDVYAFNPNLSFVEGGTPAAGSKAARIAEMNGLTCQWVNNSSSATIDVAVAKLRDDQLTDLKNLAVTESTQVPTYGAPPVEGYFTVVENQGEAQVFSGSYWVTLRSVDFFEPGDVEQLAEAAIANLPA